MNLILEPLKNQICRIFRNLDLTLASVGAISSLLLFLWLYSASAQLTYMVATLMFLTTCISYFAFTRVFPAPTAESRMVQKIRNERTLFIYSSSIFFILFTIQTFILMNRPDIYSRPASYFFISCALAGIIGVEIATISMNVRRSMLVLMKILMLTISYTFSQQFLFPISLLGVDSWTYAAYSDRMLDAGAILDGWAYSGLPLFDLEVGLTRLITGLNYKFSSITSVGLIQTICDILFVYLIGRSVWNERVGLFGSLMIGLADQHLSLNWAPMATTMAATLMMIVIYLIVVKMDKRETGYVILLLLSFTAVVLTHTVTALCLAIILLTFSIWPTIYRWGSGTPAPPRKSHAITITCISIMLGWWIVGSGQFSRIIYTIGKAFKFDFSNGSAPINEYTSAVISYANSLPISELILQRLGMFAFFAIALFGCLIFFSKENYNPKRSSLAMSGLITLAIGFLPFASAMGMMHRWWYYSQLILAPLVGVAILVWTSSIKVSSLKATFTFIVTTTLVALLIFNPIANTDNPLIASDLSHRYGLTQAEISGIISLTNVAESTVSADSYYLGVIKSDYYTRPSKVNTVSFSPGLISNDYTKPIYGLMIIRDEIADNSFLCYGQFYKLDYDPHDSAMNQGLNRVYDSQCLSAYQL